MFSLLLFFVLFFFNDTATTEIYTLSLHDALPISVRAAIIAGGWIGFALGLVAGSVLGATLAWFAGAILGWQRDLSLPLGVTEQLLPFGSQVPVLERVQADWFIVVPFAGVLVGLFAALVGGLIGGLVAASYNRSPCGVQVVVG